MGDGEESVATARAFARLETLIEKSGEDTRRQFVELRDQFGHIRGSVAHTQGSIEELRARMNDLEKREAGLATSVKSASDTAGAAMRAARDSSHDIQTHSQAMIEHLRRAEEAETARRSMDESRKLRAAETAAARFQEQGAAIHGLSEAFRKSTQVSSREKWLYGAILAIVTVLGNQIVEGYKASEVPHSVQVVPR